MRPMSLLIHPVMGMITAFAARYAVMDQVASSMPAERLPLIWSRETFTTEVSRTTMSMGSITVPATSHLFACGGDGGFITHQLRLLHFYRYCGLNRHAHAQDVLRVGVLFQYDLYGDTLHYLHVVARGVLRREQGEDAPGPGHDAVDRS